MFSSLLFKWFVPGLNGEPTTQQRTRCGMVCGIIGIACNLLLVIVKVTLAVFCHSIAMAADALNNLSDMASGIITAAGFKMSAAPPDAEHPFGHGRMEYVAGLVVSLLIVGLGITFLKDSAVSLFQTQILHCDTLAIIVFSATILVKCWLFFFYNGAAKLLRSDVLRASAYDSLSDCLGTLIVVGALIASRYTAFPVDGTAGILVALMILYAGGKVLKETVSKLLGEVPADDLVEKLRNLLLSCPGIDGLHCITIHNYGENSYYVTAHAEISDQGDRLSAHDILEKAEVLVSQKLPVHLMLHGDPYCKVDAQVILWRGRLENALAAYDSDLRIYDFRVSKNEQGVVRSLGFHVLIPVGDISSETEIRSVLETKVKNYEPQPALEITCIAGMQ